MPLAPNALIFLLGEDFDRALLLQSHIVRAGVPNPIFAIRYFPEAKAHLAQLATDKQWLLATSPHLAVVSLDEHGGALDFLVWKRTQPAFDATIVLLLAERSRHHNLQKALDLGANGFHYKDAGLREFAEEVRKLTLYSLRSPALYPAT